MEEKKEKKPRAKKVEKKPTLQEQIVEFANAIDKHIRDQRGKSLSSVACARLGKARQDLLYISKTILK